MKKSEGENTKKESNSKQLTWILIGVGLSLLVIAITLGTRNKDRDTEQKMEQSEQRMEKSPDTQTSSPLPVDRPGTKIPEGVELFEHEGSTHVAEGVRVTYKTDPPTSGSHYDRWASPGIYEASEIQPELLVHNLEHGNIVIYFDRSALSASQMDELILLSKPYIGQWDGVVLVGGKDKKHPLILTAWRAMLRLKQFDKEKVLGFMEAFRGRGPENPVR